jgi:hypothetical protein
MRMRLLPGVAGLCLLLVALPVRADEPKPIAPAVVLRVRPIESLVADARYLAELADKTDEFKQYEGLYKSMLKEKSLEGVDITRPLGAYGEIGPNGIDSRFVLLIPIADETTFLDFIKSKELKFEKDDDGSYKVDVPSIPQTVYFRFANKYVYVTLDNKDNIAPAILLEPSKVLPAKFAGAVSLTLDIDKIPDELKKVAIGQTANQLAEVKDKLKENKKPGETDKQDKLQEATLDELVNVVKSVLNDGGLVTLSFDVDRTKGELSASLSLAGKQGTDLAKTFADLGAAKSIGAGLIGKDSAANMLFHLTVPERLRKAMEPVLDETFKKSLDEEQDKDKRAAAEKLYKALEPTLKSGELDFGANLRGPSDKGLYAVVMAVKVKDGAAIDKTIVDLIPTLPEKDRKNISLNVAKVGSTSIHKVEGGELDQQAKDIFGSGPAYFAIRDDAVMVSLGDGALEALKDALAGKPAASKAIQFEMSMNRVLKLVPKEQQKVVDEAAKKAFAKDKDADKMTIVLEAGDALKLRFNMKAALVTFFAYMAEHQGKVD